jgi:hypothetical protein
VYIQSTYLCCDLVWLAMYIVLHSMYLMPNIIGGVTGTPNRHVSQSTRISSQRSITFIIGRRRRRTLPQTGRLCRGPMYTYNGIKKYTKLLKPL